MISVEIEQSGEDPDRTPKHLTCVWISENFHRFDMNKVEKRMYD